MPQRETAVPIRRIDPKRFGDEARRLVQSGAAVIGVGGGDGTVSSVASAIVGSNTALLPLPMGTINHFAKRVGIADLETGLRTINSHRVHSLPVGVLDDDIFVNTATFGAYADLVRRRDRMKPFLTKWPAAVLALLYTLVRVRWFELKATVEGTPFTRWTALLWVGVGRGSFLTTGDADVERYPSEMEIVVPLASSRRESILLLCRIGFDLLRGRLPSRDPALEVLHTRSLLITAPHRIGITTDGEVRRARTPLFVAIQENALRVAMPDKKDNCAE